MRELLEGIIIGGIIGSIAGFRLCVYLIADGVISGKLNNPLKEE